MKKFIIALIALALLGGGGFYYYQKTKPDKDETPADPTAKVERGDVVAIVTSDGKMVSNLDVEIKCKASGEIIKLPFDVSDKVQKGQLLVQLDPTDEERSVRQQAAALESSLAKVEVARQNLAVAEANLETQLNRAESALLTAKRRTTDLTAKSDRTKELFDRKLVSHEEMETAETNLIAAEADVTAAEIRLKELETVRRGLEVNRQEIRAALAQVDMNKIALEVARQRLSETRVTASMDGIVTDRKVQVGQIISSPISNVGGGTTVMVLSDLSKIFMLASVDESDIGKVRLGQKANMRVDAFPARNFEGEVVQISPLGVNVSNVVTFQVKIEVTSPEKRVLLPEMTATAEIVTAKAENTLKVPSEAVYKKGGTARVNVVAADGVTKTEREVQTGIGNGQVVEILSGLAEGETVVVKKGENESKWRGGPPMMFGGRRR